MIYNVFYYLIKITCFFYFKKTSIHNPENLSADKPTIICANHGNSFMDAILIAINSKRPLHFLVRADVFNSPFKRWFFGQLNMLPIYRIRDGREALKNNDSIFLKCKNILEKNGALVVFPEGNCIVEKRLRAFKTGFVHLAFNTPLQNLQVLPVAINYSQPDAFYTEASLSFLMPISVEEIKALTNHQELEFNKLLLERTHSILQKNMVIIPSKENDVFYEQILEIQRNSFQAEQQFFVSKQIETAEKLTKLKTLEPLKFDLLKNLVTQYYNELAQENVLDETIAESNVSDFKLGLVFPFYFTGLILNIVPSAIINYVINHKIREKQFKSSVRMVLSLFIYPIYLLIVSVLLNLIFGNFVFSLSIVIVMMLIYYSNFKAFQIKTQQKELEKYPEINGNLRGLRLKILNSINL